MDIDDVCLQTVSGNCFGNGSWLYTNTYKWSCNLPFRHFCVHLFIGILESVSSKSWILCAILFFKFLIYIWLIFSCIVSGLIWKNSFSFLYDSLLNVYFLFPYVFPEWNTVLFKIFIICIIFRSFLFFPSIFWDMNIRSEPSIQVKLLLWLHLSPYTHRLLRFVNISTADQKTF